MKIKIFADIHEYGTCDLQIPLSYGNDCYYGGDNVDMDHCHYSEIGHAYEKLKLYRKLFGDRFVRGNHELNLIDAPDFIVVGDTVICHGDQIFWDHEKSENYRHRTPGLSLPRQWITEGVIDFLRHLTPAPGINIDQELRAIRIACQYGVRRVICAHRHPRKAYEYQIGEITLIVLPRGISEVEVNL